MCKRLNLKQTWFAIACGQDTARYGAQRQAEEA
jgi:hypothetical protein